MMNPIHLDNYPLLRSGKVRDIYDAGDHLILVASDRLSAFDVILPTPIPDKGKILTRISARWFERTQKLCPNHVLSTDVATLELGGEAREALAGRTMICRKADRIDIECVVRGYLAGSGFKEYAENGTLAGETLPNGMRRADQLPEPRFTPAVKNDQGHDENISRAALRDRVGADLADVLEKRSLSLYQWANAAVQEVGLTLADTKFEFGYINGELSLIDEAFTPDSSRYWETTSIVPGSEPESFDKQIVRNWLELQDWEKTFPGPEIPDEIVSRVRNRYVELEHRLDNI